MPWIPVPAGDITIGGNPIGIGDNASLGATGVLSTAIINSSTPFQPLYSVLDATRARLKDLLSTRIGERIMHPEYGTDLMKVVFEPNNDSIKSIIQTLLTDPINYWIPDIQIRDIEIITAEDDPNLTHDVKINLSYSVQAFDSNTIVLYLNAGNTIIIIEE